MRSASVGNSNADPAVAGGVAMQDFGADGLPPPPPVGHSWMRIDRWAERQYPELFDQLCEGATGNDLNELEHELDCSLPMEVRESLMIHDGQERGGRPTGIILGHMLLDCEEILDEWNNWRKVNAEFLSQQQPLRVATGVASSSKANGGPTGAIGDLKSRQDCHPEGTIQKVYAHPGWIPMVRDWGGNNIAVDLAPGPNGKWGQVILFGRDYDCKFVVARSWAAFLAMVADDLESPHWYVEEESGELRLRDPKAPKYEPTYMEILRVRCEKKYGRRMRRRPGSSGPGSPASGRNTPTSGFLSPPSNQSRSSRGKESTLHHPKPIPLPQLLEEDGLESKVDSAPNGSSRKSNETSPEVIASSLQEISLEEEDEDEAPVASSSKPPTVTVESVPDKRDSTGKPPSVKRTSVEA